MKHKLPQNKKSSGTDTQSSKISSRKNTSSKSEVQTDVQFVLQHLNTPVNIFNHREKNFIYVNDKFAGLTGLSQEEFYDQELKNFNSWINDDDLSMLQTQIGKRLKEIYRLYKVKGNTQLTYHINFRLKEKLGHEDPVYVLAQCSVVEWDENYFPAITFNTLTDITHYKSNQKMILSVNMFDISTNQWKTVHKEEFLRVPQMLSNREKQITEHILRDKSATEISQDMNMPFYTVRSHWRNILQKTRCKTQKELKQMAHKEGWV